jgi:hypothetical protein
MPSIPIISSQKTPLFPAAYQR